MTLKPRVRDTANGTTAPGYVRGEEVLGAWRPRSASLVAEHRSQLHRMYTTADVERTRQFLQLRKEVGQKGRKAVGRTAGCRGVRAWPDPLRPPLSLSALTCYSSHWRRWLRTRSRVTTTRTTLLTPRQSAV